MRSQMAVLYLNHMEFINIQIADNICVIALNRKEKYNAFNWPMLQDLAQAFHQANVDDNVRAVVLQAEGDHFTSGLDLADVTQHLQQQQPLFDPQYPDPFRLQNDGITKPLIVAVKGYCFTIGIELTLAADYVVAHPDTTFAQMEVQRGIMPFGGATLRLPHRVGWGNAMRILLTGEPFHADDAHRIDLIQEVDSNPVERAMTLAGSMAKQAPLAVQAALQNARTGFLNPTDAIAEMMETTHRLMATQDAKEGLQAFIERRSANFTGQ